MASLTKVNTTISSAVDIPEKWSRYVVQLLEANTVADKCFMDFSPEVMNEGDIIHVPENNIKQTAATFTEGNRLTDKLQADTKGSVTITINQYKVNPFVVSDKLSKQSAYNEKAHNYKIAAFAIKEIFDDYVLGLSSSFTVPDVNSGGSTITNKDITEAWTRLNANNVPAPERSWIFNPWAIKDLYDLTGNYFTSIDFTTYKPLVNGQVPKLLLGSPVFISTNVPETTAGSPAQNIMNNIYAHREAIGWAAQFKDQVQETKPGDGVSIDIQGTLCNVRSLYGASVLDGAKGVRVRRQNTYA